SAVQVVTTIAVRRRRASSCFISALLLRVPDSQRVRADYTERRRSDTGTFSCRRASAGRRKRRNAAAPLLEPLEREVGAERREHHPDERGGQHVARLEVQEEVRQQRAERDREQ